jgi:hypothetical protein
MMVGIITMITDKEGELFDKTFNSFHLIGEKPL